MSTLEDVTRVLATSRNGMNRAIRYNRFVPRFIISDGAQELAEAAGCYWLIDVLATELEPKLLASINAGEVSTAQAHISVSPTGAAELLVLVGDDRAQPYWRRRFSYTDFPAGDWHIFEIGAFSWDQAAERATSVIAILPSEH